LHIACAESTLSKKFKCRFYRCPVCLSDKSNKNMPKRKRANTDGDAAGLPGNRAFECSMSSHGEEEEIDQSGDGDTSDGSCTDASGKSNLAIDALPIIADCISEDHLSALDTFEYHEYEFESVGNSSSNVSSVFDGDSEDTMFNEKSGFRLEPFQQTKTNHGSKLSSVLEEACTDLFFMKNTLHSLREDLQTCRDSVVSPENGKQVREVLKMIRSGFNQLTHFAGQFQHAHGIPFVNSSDADSHSFGGEVGELNVVRDALLEFSAFDQSVLILHPLYQALHSYSAKADSSLAADIPKDVSFSQHRAPPVADSAAVSPTVPHGIANSSATLCCYICLLQAWFHIKAFKKAVFHASLTSEDDSFTLYLSSIFYCLQTGKAVDLKVLLCSYFLCPSI
jgi:hypothetical protein